MNTTSTQQLALPAPYGYKDGYHISLRAEEGFNLLETEQTLVRFGCPRRIAQKAMSCLRNSQRYDCVVSPEWFRDDGRALKQQLFDEGVEVVVLGKPGPDPGKTARQARQGGFRFGQFVPGTDGARSVPDKHPLHDELVSRYIDPRQYRYPPRFDNLPRYQNLDFAEIEQRVLRYLKD